MTTPETSEITVTPEQLAQDAVDAYAGYLAVLGQIKQLNLEDLDTTMAKLNEIQNEDETGVQNMAALHIKISPMRSFYVGKGTRDGFGRWMRASDS